MHVHVCCTLTHSLTRFRNHDVESVQDAAEHIDDGGKSLVEAAKAKQPLLSVRVAAVVIGPPRSRLQGKDDVYVHVHGGYACRCAWASHGMMWDAMPCHVMRAAVQSSSTPRCK